MEDVKIETAEISSKFKFFETYKPNEKEKKQFRITPPRDGVVKSGSPEQELYRDPTIARGDEYIDDPVIAEKSHTATKMLSIFRQMESKKNPMERDGIKPLKQFTPPPDEGRRLYANQSDSDNVTDSEDSDLESEEDEEEESDEDDVNYSNKFEDEFLKQAKSLERAKQLRAKFEKWETNEIKKEQNNSSVCLYEPNDDSQVESTRSICAKFELMRKPSTTSHDRIKVNRFV